MKIRTALDLAVRELSHLKNGEMEAHWLLEFIGYSPILDGGLELDLKSLSRLQNCIKLRKEGMSLFRVMREKEFYNTKVQVSTLVFEPRWDSEVLLEVAKACSPPDTKSVLDLGTGSGCLLLAALKIFPNADGLGVDQDPNALELARKNAELTNVTRAKFALGNWGEGIEGYFDLILSNPPYIPSSKVEQVSGECGDPSYALDGGKNGLDCYPVIMEYASQLLTDNGVCVMEHGYNQQKALIDLISSHRKLRLVSAYKDLSGNERAVAVKRH